MASNANISTTGYDAQLVDSYPPLLNCGICTLILRDAMHGCINHVFCKACIIKHIECGIKTDGNVMCPGGCNIVINPAKEAHDVECLNEQVECIYYDIGCKKELRRKDIHPHEQTNHAEHTRLIYQSLTNSNNQIKALEQENVTLKQENDGTKQENYSLKKDAIVMKQEFVVMKEEIVLLKQENSASKKKYEGKVNILKNDISQLKQFVQNNKTEFEVVKNEISKVRSDISKTSDKIDVATNEVMLMKSEEKLKNIDSLKKKLNMTSSLHANVSLITTKITKITT